MIQILTYIAQQQHLYSEITKLKKKSLNQKLTLALISSQLQTLKHYPNPFTVPENHGKKFNLYLKLNLALTTIHPHIKTNKLHPIP